MRNLTTEITHSNLAKKPQVCLSESYFISSEAIKFCEAKYGAVIMKL